MASLDHVPEQEPTAQPASMNAMEMMVGYILLVGVILSALLIITGTLWNWARYGNLTSQFTISGENYFGFLTSSFNQLLIGAIQPHLLVSLGIITLMFTPYLRVAASMIYFAFIARNIKYALFTLFVLSVLTYSLFLR